VYFRKSNVLGCRLARFPSATQVEIPTMIVTIMMRPAAVPKTSSIGIRVKVTPKMAL
jgi:hypothetical protein